MVQPPSRNCLRDLVAAYHASPSPEAVAAFESLAADWLADFDRLDELASQLPKRCDRTPHAVEVRRGDNPANVFISRCHIEGADAGPLAGYELGVKDNVAVAGVEMTCGSAAFEGFVPSRDAVVVERLLGAGATLIGKLNLEAMAFSGSGELSDYGTVPNPCDEAFLAGGSSSGCAAAVVDDTVDIAIGTDQSGSIRVPAAWSGCVGIKPTFGLVPYTGGVSLEPTIDHIGPMTATVGDCALALDVIAGGHPSDSRQSNPPDVDATAAINQDDSLTIGVLEEAFGFDVSEPAVSKAVRETLDALAVRGHEVIPVSIPWHDDGYTIYNGIILEAFAALVRDEGVGYYRRGSYNEQFRETFAEIRRDRADHFPPAMLLTLGLGRYLAQEYRGAYHARAQRLRQELRRRYDDALADLDVLAMPTTPQTAHERASDQPLGKRIERSLDMFQNTAPFNLTGHPAISVPVGSVDGLPVGIQFVGKIFDDGTVLRAAHAVEQLCED